MGVCRRSNARRHFRVNRIKGSYQLTDDKRRFDLRAIHRLLSDTYWAADRPRATMKAAIDHSVCVGLFREGEQIGFARAVTDHATFTWICDVIIHPDHRGKGLGKWLVECLVTHPKLQTRSQVLATRDAHGLYERFGFTRTEYMKRLLDTHKRTVQKAGAVSRRGGKAKTR
jgi:GNAT superfamily N-acetyltransferase